MPNGTLPEAHPYDVTVRIRVPALFAEEAKEKVALLVEHGAPYGRGHFSAAEMVETTRVTDADDGGEQ